MAVKVRVSEVSKSFILAGGSVEVLERISLHIDEGEFVSLLGPSGCGKSTVLNLISGLIAPDRGEIEFLAREKKVSYMPQKDLLLPWRTVIENASIPLEIRGTAKRKAREEAAALMPLFGLKGFENCYPNQLSGGMRQRAAVLRTFLHRAEVLLLDEPFGKLDALTRRNLQQWLLTVWGEFRQSVLFVTHDIDEAIFLSDRIYVMSERPGTVKADLEVDLTRPREKETVTSAEFVTLKKKILELL